MEQFPARIHVLLASTAPLGVVIRRGPSKQVATVLWDRSRDDFQLGQWLKGRLYERRSDLSPDGKHLIYFAMNGKWQSEAKGAWTAVSRAPYLKALAIFPKGDCWYGGGLWTNTRTYWLNDDTGHSVLRDTAEVRRDRQCHPVGQFGGECLSVYYPRLIRDGWLHVDHTRSKTMNREDVFEKSAHRGWILRKIAHIGASADGHGCYWDEHQLVHTKSFSQVECPTWEWADIDGERLVWATEGKLFAGRLTKSGLTAQSELCNFNEMEFTPIEAPY